MQIMMIRFGAAVPGALRAAFLVVVSLLFTACSDDDDSGGNPTGGDNNDNNPDRACSLDTEKSQILEIMEQWYFWNDEAVQADKYAGINLDDYSDGEDLLDYLRYRKNSRDRGFTHITTPEQEEAFYEEGEYVGFGFSFLRNPSDTSGAVWISQVYAGSPAAEAGIERGYELLAINGADVQAMTNPEVTQALGPPETGFTRTLQVADRNDTVLPEIELTKDTVTIETVPVATVIEDDGGNPIAGYLVLGTFIGPAEQALQEAFADFRDEGIDTLIVDLRYNGGGRVDIARLFASLLAGPGNTGNPFIMFQYNSDRASKNSTINFSAENNAIDLASIVFITTNFSASASELVISGLQPYFDTTGKELASVGTSTFGKPVGQSAFDFCNDNLRLRAVTFKSVNADGEGEYYNGLPVDCTVGDDLQLPFGDENESMLSVALEYIESGGTCPVAAGGRRAIASQSGAGKQQVISGPYPWQRYAGAH